MSGLRIALINEGTYPYAGGGVSVWCDHLVHGLADHTFELVTITATDGMTAKYRLPPNVTRTRPVPLWGGPGRRFRVPSSAVMVATEALDTLFRALVGREDMRAAGAEQAMRALAALSAKVDLRSVLGLIDGAPLLLDAVARADESDWPRSHRLSLHDAMLVAELVEHALYPLAVDLPDVDLCHAVANGLSSMVALANQWRRGTPFLMSEHGVYLRERYLERAVGLSHIVRMLLLRFHRALAMTGYACADRIVPCTRFNQRWAERCGAVPSKIEVVANGIDPQLFTALDTEPEVPTLVWVGRIDPLKDLETLVDAFALVVRVLPGARLEIVGPTPETNVRYAARVRAHVAELDLAGRVQFCGPVADSREAYARGQVVVLSSVSEGLPYTVIEAMMCRRPVVATNVGGVAEAVGDGGRVVPPRDPVALAAACLELLTDSELRSHLGTRAAHRARKVYHVDLVTEAFRGLYGSVVRRARAPHFTLRVRGRRPRLATAVGQ